MWDRIQVRLATAAYSRNLSNDKAIEFFDRTVRRQNR